MQEQQPIATPEEILATYTSVLRTGKPAEQLRAGELLAKHLPMEFAGVPKEQQIDLIAMLEHSGILKREG